jgi:uncharacterized membrane protein
MYKKNQQLNKLFDQTKIQKLPSLDIAQTHLIKLLITLNKLKSNHSNLFDLVNAVVISQLIFINNLRIKNILLIQLTIKYFTPFTNHLILHVGTALTSVTWVVHSRTYLYMTQSKQRYRVRADELMTHKFKTKF